MPRSNMNDTVQATSIVPHNVNDVNENLSNVAMASTAAKVIQPGKNVNNDYKCGYCNETFLASTKRNVRYKAHKTVLFLGARLVHNFSLGYAFNRDSN